MIRILHMIGSLNVGGSQAMVMNLYRNIDRNQVQFDFIIDHPEQLHFADEIKRLGGRIFSLPSFQGINMVQVRKAWNVFFIEHPEYRILHSHVRSYASVYIPIARKHGLKTIIHSHSTSNGGGVTALIKCMLQYPLRFQADYFFGCSKIAGEWLFGRAIVNGERYYMMQNAIDLKMYRYKKETRDKYRKEIGAKDQVVFGHVGRFHIAKNHVFLLEVFSCIHRKMPKSRLMIVGDGDLRPLIEKKISELELQDSVVLMGMRSDVNELMQAMDCFLFPSKWEGLPVTVVEAQAAGLPCFVSDTVTRDVGLSELVTYLPIDQGPEVWEEKVLDSCLIRKDVSSDIIRSGFDITSSSAWLSEFYRSIYGKRSSMITLFTSNTSGGIIQMIIQLLDVINERQEDVCCFIPEGAIVSVPDRLREKIYYYKKFKALNPWDGRVKRLAKSILDTSPELVWYADSSILSLEVSRHLSGRVTQILTLHDAGTWHPANSISLKKKIQMKYSGLLLKQSVKAVSNILVLSEESRKACLKRYPYAAEKTLLLTLGAHVPKVGEMKPEELSGIYGSYYLFFGRIDKYKGIGILCEAYSELQGEKIPLVIAGNGKFTEEEQAAIDGDSYIKLVNRYISDGEMVWLFKNARAVVLPYIEATQSGVIPIAYKYGVPVITSDVPGLVQFVDNNKTGYICKNRCDYIDSFKSINDERNYLRMRTYCQRYSEAHFNWNINVISLMETIGIW